MEQGYIIMNGGVIEPHNNCFPKEMAVSNAFIPVL